MVFFIIYSPSTDTIAALSPKSGCTLMRQLWYRIHKIDMIRDKPTNLWHAVEKDFLYPPRTAKRGYIIVRDPYKRVVSMFTNRLTVSYPYTKDLRNLYEKIMNTDKYTFRNFCLFLKKLKDTNKLSIDIHLLPQSYVPEINGYKINIEDLTVIKLEDDVLTRLKEYYNDSDISQTIDEFYKDEKRIKNVTSRIKETDTSSMVDVNMKNWTTYPDYIRFMDPECLNIIKEIYNKDYELFGY